MTNPKMKHRSKSLRTGMIGSSGAAICGPIIRTKPIAVTIKCAKGGKHEDDKTT